MSDQIGMTLICMIGSGLLAVGLNILTISQSSGGVTRWAKGQVLSYNLVWSGRNE